MDAISRTPRPAEPAGPGGGRTPTPAPRPGVTKRLVRRLSESTWAPVAAKAAAILAGMLALAGIGAASIARGPGVPVAAAAPTPSAATGGWIAPDRPAPHEQRPVAAPLGSAAAGPSAAPPGSASGAHGGPGTPGVTADGKIVLNRATAEDLTKLPRVGAKRAHEILQLRARMGKFRQPTDLLRVRGIGRKTLRHMLPLLVVDAPAAPSVPEQGAIVPAP